MDPKQRNRLASIYSLASLPTISVGMRLSAASFFLRSSRGVTRQPAEVVAEPCVDKSHSKVRVILPLVPTADKKTPGR